MVILHDFISRYTPYQESIKEAREDRMLSEAKDPLHYESLKERKFVPKTVFETNKSPSLEKKEWSSLCAIYMLYCNDFPYEVASIASSLMSSNSIICILKNYCFVVNKQLAQL